MLTFYSRWLRFGRIITENKLPPILRITINILKQKVKHMQLCKRFDSVCSQKQAQFSLFGHKNIA